MVQGSGRGVEACTRYLDNIHGIEEEELHYL